MKLRYSKEAVVIATCAARGLALSVLLLAGSSLAFAQAGGMAGMPGMHMAKVVVKPGAGITVADVEFMQGMIAHHAQAVYMSRLAGGHGANPRVLALAKMIDQSQIPEIIIMQNWLRRYDQFVPDTSSWHNMPMPGMLTDDQIKALNAAQGVDFDRKFLEYMIQHHSGAIKMVNDLFATPGAGQEVDTSVFANDVVTVQTGEIGIMLKLRKDELP
ncbi:MAG: DUF305 domain-containing protein [Gemmatimonadetes bacterium]|nr:DUF305 domain-containing protein [Gemmatimonadota bacterium]